MLYDRAKLHNDRGRYTMLYDRAKLHNDRGRYTMHKLPMIHPSLLPYCVHAEQTQIQDHAEWTQTHATAIEAAAVLCDVELCELC